MGQVEVVDADEVQDRCVDVVYTDAIHSRLLADIVGFAPPGGESFAQVIERVSALVDGLTGPSILVTHAGVIRALWHVVGGWPAAKAAVEPVPYGRAIRILWSPQAWRRA